MIFGSNVGNMGNYEFLKEIQKCNTKDDIENFIDSKYLIVVDAGIFCDDEVNVNIRFNDKSMIDNLKDDISDLIFSLKNDKYYAETKIAVFDLKVTDEFKNMSDKELKEKIEEDFTEFTVGGNFIKGNVLMEFEVEDLEKYVEFNQTMEFILEDGFKNLAKEDINCEMELKIGETDSFKFKAKDLKDDKFSLNIEEQDLNIFLDKTMKYIALNDCFGSNEFYQKNAEYQSYQFDCSCLKDKEEKYQKLNEIKESKATDILSKEVENLTKTTSKLEMKATFYNDDRNNEFEVGRDGKNYIKVEGDLELDVNYKMSLILPSYTNIILNELDNISNEVAKHFEKNNDKEI